MALHAGDTAPDFTLPDQDGVPVRLYDLLLEKPVVLFFYPKDNTPICTREACAFRDSYPLFTGIGAEVLGISIDSVESHQGFARKLELPFRILSDEKKEVQTLYGIATRLGFLPDRVTFVIGKDGVVRHAYNSPLRAAAHAEGALAALKKSS